MNLLSPMAAAIQTSIYKSQQINKQPNVASSKFGGMIALVVDLRPLSAKVCQDTISSGLEFILM